MVPTYWHSVNRATQASQELLISESISTGALCNGHGGTGILQISMDHSRHDSYSADKILVKAVKNEWCGLQILPLLFERRYLNLIFTEGALAASERSVTFF